VQLAAYAAVIQGPVLASQTQRYLTTHCATLDTGRKKNKAESKQSAGETDVVCECIKERERERERVKWRESGRGESE